MCGILDLSVHEFSDFAPFRSLVSLISYLWSLRSLVSDLSDFRSLISQIIDFSNLRYIRSWISQILVFSDLGSIRSQNSKISDCSDLKSVRYCSQIRSTRSKMWLVICCWVSRSCAKWLCFILPSITIYFRRWVGIFSA